MRRKRRSTYITYICINGVQYVSRKEVDRYRYTYIERMRVRESEEESESESKSKRNR